MIVSLSAPSTTQNCSCRATVGSTWAGPDPGAVADGPVARLAGQQGGVLVGTEEHVAVVPRRVAVVHPERLQPGVDHDPSLGADGDDRGQQRERLLERRVEFGVLRVHQHVGAGLQLRAPFVHVPRAGPAARHDVAADHAVRPQKDLHRCRRTRVDLLGPVLDHHQVTLVPHHPADVQPGRPGPVGEPPGVVDVAAAPWQADLHVDQNRTDPAAHRGIEGRVRVDRDGDLRRIRSRPRRSVSRVSLASRRSAPRPACDHPFDLAWRRGAERGVARVGQAARPARST